MKKRFVFITAQRKELRGGNMKKRRLMLCSIISLIMVFVMAVPMTVSAAEAKHIKDAGELQAAVKAGGEIVLDDNIIASITIPKGVTVTLDLNGKTLTGGAKDAIYVSLGATLTINDSVGNGSVKAATGGKAAVFNNGTTTIKNGYYTRSAGQWYTIVNHGTMTIENAKADASIDGNSSLIENGYSDYYNKTKDERYGHIDGTNAANPNLTINGGSFTSTGFNTVKNDDGGVLTINSGIFKAAYVNKSIKPEDKDNLGSAIQNWNVATINGGTFISTQNTVVISSGAYKGTVDKGITQINNGSFKSENGLDLFGIAVGGDSVGALTISDGDFSGNLGLADVATKYTATLTGGSYTDINAKDFIEEDHILIQYKKSGQNGKYYVGTPEKIQDIANTAKDGDTIDVIKGSITLNMTTPGVNVNNDRSNEKGEVIVNGTPLNPGYGMEIQKPATDPTKPSQDQTQKPSDTAKADKSAKTGDDFNLFAVGGVALAAIIAMAAVAITGRRHRQR